MGGKKKAAAASEAADEPMAAGSAAEAPHAELTSKDYYFQSYSHFGIHEEMLKDSVRTKAYQSAIMNNPHLFKGKTVLDVGCGTAILCMFAAKAGAARVIGIECSEIIEQAREIVALNGLAHVITLVKGKVEDVELPDGLAHVDIIVSEWMGYFLLYEGMLDTVIHARDRWLAPGGHILPDKASLQLVAIEDAEYRREKLEFWDNVYGFNMQPIKRMAMFEPLVDVVDPHQVVTHPCTVLEIDIMTATVADLAFAADFALPLHRTDFVHALVAYFDVTFSCCHKPVVMPTAPHCKPTHWKQTVFYLPEPLVATAGDAIRGRVVVRPNAANHRDLEIVLDVTLDGAKTDGPVTQRAEYRLR